MTDLPTLRAALQPIRSGRERLRGELEALHATLDAAPAEEHDDIRARLDEMRRELAGFDAQERRAAPPPEEMDALIGELDPELPILLFPLRVQTRIRHEAGGRRLLVRAYPDEVCVAAHDPRLSAAEAEEGAALWAAPDLAPDDATPAKAQRFRAMAAARGTPRAAFIAEATRAGTVAEAAAGRAVASFRILPERLAFRLIGPGGAVLAERFGEPIPDGIAAGFDPTREGRDYRRGDEFALPPELAWQADFGAAQAIGLACAFDFDALGVERIERVIVLGVRLGDEPRRSAGRLSNLLDGHRFSNGLAILRNGTPTNITRDDDEPAPDADAAWAQLNAPAPPDPHKLTFDKLADGARLALAFGLQRDSFDRVVGANGQDGVDGIAMRRAMWAGTLGYYARQMLAPATEGFLLPKLEMSGDEVISVARLLATNFVAGGGPLPAIRIGDQPYGVLPVQPNALGRRRFPVAPWGAFPLDGALDVLHGKLHALLPAWRQEIAALPRTGPGPDGARRLLEVLSRQASSVEFRLERLLGPEYLKTYVDFRNLPGPQFQFASYQASLTARLDGFRQSVPGVLPDAMTPVISTLGFYGLTWRKIAAGIGKPDRSLVTPLTGDVVDEFPPSETRHLGEAGTYPNYLGELLGGDTDRIRRGLTRRLANGTEVPVASLLYLMLRQSLLQEHAVAAARLAVQHGGEDWSAFREKELVNIWFGLDRLVWDALYRPRSWTLAGLPQPSAAADLVMKRDGLRRVMRNWSHHFADIEETERALAHLAKRPTAVLERCFAETLDIASYRIDAWITGFAFQSLLSRRIWPEARRQGRPNPAREEGGGERPIRFNVNARPVGGWTPGLSLGAFGWVEDLVPDAAPEGVDDEVPAELRPAEGGVVREAASLGTVLAPSPNHAVTAALLRAGAASEPGRDAFNIHLSSARTRDALWLIEGVRNGQPPAALLGYRFERLIRDNAPGLQAILPALRLAFPMPTPAAAAGGPAPAIPPRDVVNGLRIVQRLEAGVAAFDADLDVPIQGLSVADADAARAELLRFAQDLLGLFDAGGDLMLAESVHQAALGNQDRAAGIVTAAGEFTHVPDRFDVAATPRGGRAVAHRLLVLLPQVAAAAGSAPRAALAPALDAAIGELVGPLSRIACGVAYALGDGTTVTESATLDEIGLAPLEVALLADETGLAELTSRLDLLARPRLRASRRKVEITGRTLATHGLAVAGARALGELLPVLRRARRLLSARAATWRDLVPQDLLKGASRDEVERVDTDELFLRVLGGAPGAAPAATGLLPRFVAARDALDAEGAKVPANAAALSAALLEASRFGLQEAVPVPDEAEGDLAARAVRTVQAMGERIATAEALVQGFIVPPARTVGPLGNAAAAPRQDAPERVALCHAVTEALLGGGFPLLPLVVPPAATPLHGPLAVERERAEDWLLVAARLRAGASDLSGLRVLADATAAALRAPEVLQWPAALGTWAADALPDEMPKGEIVSVFIQPLGNADLTQPFAGLLLDEWSEVVPERDGRLGLAVHHDAPNAEPPQALILAVPEDGAADGWRWSRAALLACVEGSLALAKVRAVGPDELRRTQLDFLLPATVAPETVTPHTISTSYIANAVTEAAAMLHAIQKQG